MFGTKLFCKFIYMMDLIKIPLLFCPYLIINLALDNFYNKKNSRNMVASIHALGSVLLNGIYMLSPNNDVLRTCANDFSIGYFLYDTYYIFANEKLNFLRAMYVYHHLSTTYLLFNSHLFGNTNQLIFLGELSNLPSYVIYHYLHEGYDSNNKIIKNTKIIQKYVYGLIRLPIMTGVLYNMINNLDFNNYEVKKTFAIVSPIYVMGLVWTFKLISQ